MAKWHTVKSKVHWTHNIYEDFTKCVFSRINVKYRLMEKQTKKIEIEHKYNIFNDNTHNTKVPRRNL